MMKDTKGSVGLEFGIAIPVLAALMIGVLQFALVLSASGSMRHAMGEGLRLAKVNPSATTTAVLDQTRAQFVGGNVSNITALTFTRSTQTNGAQVGAMTMTYAMQPVIPFVPLPAITLTETKTVYLPS